MFQDISRSDDAESNVRDVVGGSFLWESDVYRELTIKMAYAAKTASGSKTMTFEFVDNSVNPPKTLRSTQYITTSSGSITFKNKDGKDTYMSGFIIADHICALAGSAYLDKTVFEKKVIPVYDYDKKADVNTEMDVATGLLGKTITLGVLRITKDKTKDTGTKDVKGKAVYAPTGETTDINEIDKVFQPGTGLTVIELKQKQTTAEFITNWESKNKGVTRNQAKGLKPGGPAAFNAAPAGGASAPNAAPSLF